MIALALALTAVLPGFGTYTTKGGATAHWDTATFCYEMSDALPADVDLDRAEGLLSTAVRTWTTLPCAPKSLEYRGRTLKTHVDPDRGSGNTVVWVTDPANWIHSSTYYALTTLQAQPDDGVIVDADLEVNWGGHVFSMQDPCPTGAVDLWNVLTHEAGHLMGLNHSDVPQATLFHESGSCDTHMRDLDQDDIDGYCWLAATYPPTEAVAPCRAEADGADVEAVDVPGADGAAPDADESGADAEPGTVVVSGGGGCAAGPGAYAPGWAMGLLLVALAGLRPFLRHRQGVGG